MIDGALNRGRMPFMDTILASVVARFSDEFLIGGNGGRAVLRRSGQSPSAAHCPTEEGWIPRSPSENGSEVLIAIWMLVREDPAWRESSAGHSFAPCQRNTLPDDRIAKNYLVVDEPRDVLRTFKRTACMPTEAATARLAPWMACIYLSNQHGTSELTSSAAPFSLEDHYRAAEAWEPAPRLECLMIAALRWRASDQNHREGA